MMNEMKLLAPFALDEIKRAMAFVSPVEKPNDFGITHLTPRLRLFLKPAPGMDAISCIGPSGNQTHQLPVTHYNGIDKLFCIMDHFFWRSSIPVVASY